MRFQPYREIWFRDSGGAPRLRTAAMLSDSPTLIIEHHELYGRQFSVPEGVPDHLVMPGKAAVVRQGRDVTVVGYSFTVPQALEAARQLEGEGIDAEVLDLRTLDAAGTDYETLGKSVAKTGALVCADRGRHHRGGQGGCAPRMRGVMP